MDFKVYLSCHSERAKRVLNEVKEESQGSFPVIARHGVPWQSRCEEGRSLRLFTALIMTPDNHYCCKLVVVTEGTML